MAASSSGAQYVWVLVKGGARPIKVPTEGLTDVDALLQKVHAVVGLAGVRLDQLQLYQNKASFKRGEAPFLEPPCCCLPFIDICLCFG